MFSVIFRRTRDDLVAARRFGIPVAIARPAAPFAPRPATSARLASLRGRLATGMPTVQAGIVAFAATSVLVMSICLIACLVLAVAGR
ncbi:MAG: hypothetical protein R3B48_20615 [Kofleriaceae bacterium]